jgi:DNA-binding NarL/FixJ family response regulator
LDILLVDDHPMVRHSLTSVLRASGHAVVVAEGCATARPMLEEGAYDLLLLDYHLPDGTGLELLREFAGRLPAFIVVVSGVTDVEEVLFVLEHSEARAFISKDIDLDDFAEALQRVTQFADDGSTWIWRSEQRNFVPSREAYPRESTLTPKEREVFMLMREGLLDKQIAERLSRSVHTIRVQIRSIRRKRGSTRRAEIEG